MGRFLCLFLLYGMLLGCAAGAKNDSQAQPAFFSLLFPQLTLYAQESATPAEAWLEGMVFL